MERPQYRTWIRTRPLVAFTALTAGSLALCLAAFWHVAFLGFLIPAAAFGYILLIVGMARWRFSGAGGGYQARIHGLLVSCVAGDRVLDVGCGSGHLLAAIARAHPRATLVGLDYWGTEWEYSKELCEANFRAEGLEGRATFVRGTASSLPEELGEFDCVVSCLAFHEVRDVPDKTESLRQAIGRLAPGGRFVFLDLFGSRGHYPSAAAVAEAIEASGTRITERRPLGDLLAVPFPLEHKRVLGHAEIIVGERAIVPASPVSAASGSAAAAP